MHEVLEKTIQKSTMADFLLWFLIETLCTLSPLIWMVIDRYVIVFFTLSTSGNNKILY